MLDAAHSVAGLLKVAKAIALQAGYSEPSPETIATIAVVLERGWNSHRREVEDSIKGDKSRLVRRIDRVNRANQDAEKRRRQTAAAKRKS